jgi:hypothetical protein
MYRYSVTRRLLLSILVVALPPISLAQQGDPQKLAPPEKMAGPPDATIDFEASQFLLLLGGAAGEGILHFQGKKIPFTMKGASVGGVGYTDVKGSGEVRFLKKAEDFAGTYSYLGAGAALVGGRSASTFENDKGVVVTVKSETQGAALNLGVGGVSVQLKQ